MKFKMTHLFSSGNETFFTEDSPPKWLISKEYKWFYQGHVLTLDINESIKTDFREIKRVE